MSSEYQEEEAAVDALSGREACRHGLWPHQGDCEICGLDQLLSMAEAAAGVGTGINEPDIIEPLSWRDARWLKW